MYVSFLYKAVLMCLDAAYAN